MPNNLTLSGATFAASGVFDQKLTAGSGATALPVIPAGSFTIRCRVSRSGTPNLEVAVSQVDACWLGVDGLGYLRAAVGATSGGQVVVTSTAYVNDGNTHEIQVSVDATTGITISMDGVQAGSNAGTPASTGVVTSGGGAKPLFVRKLRQEGPDFLFAGHVDEVAVFNVAKPATYTVSSTPYLGTESDLVALWHLDGNGDDSQTTASPPTTATLTGPTSGTTGVASSSFTVTLNNPATAEVTVTPAGTNGTVTFSPATPTIAVGQSSVTFTANAAVNGLHEISITTSPALTYAGSPVNFTTSNAAATAITISGPSSGTVGSPSSPYSVGANGSIPGTVVVTPNDNGGGGSFSPASVSISNASPNATFTYASSSTGAKSITVTNNSGTLTNPSAITFTAGAGLKYNRIDASDPIGGQAIMVLTPSANAAIPYNPAVSTNAIIYVHGAGEAQDALLTDSRKTATVTALLDAGYILAGTNARGNNWGSQQSADDYVALEKYLRDTLNVKSICLWSQSMGGLNGLQVLSQGKFPVVGWLGTYPVVSLANLYGLGTFTSAINSAHGITGSGANTYANRTRGLDPALLQGFSWRHVPMRIYASPGDTVVPKAANGDVLAALVAGCAREAAMVVCSGEHGDASHFQVSDYLAFFARCFSSPVALGRSSVNRTATVTLTSDGTAPRANLTGIKWAWYDQITPDLSEWPQDRGSAGTTNASGVMTLTVKSHLPVGGIGWLVVTNSDGTTTQSPARLAASGPVQVAA